MIRHKSKSFDFVYGLHTVTALMRFQPERCKKLFVARKSDIDSLRDLCAQCGIGFELVERSWLEKKFAVGSDAQGLVLQCSPFLYVDVEEMLRGAKSILVLDSWQDAVNLGRAARAALCFGVDGIIICKDRSAHINAVAEKSAVGALAEVPVAMVVNLASTLKKLKEAGFFIYGADERGDVSLTKCDFALKAALVIGQEGEGLRALTKKTCDVLVSIPMAHPSICLNAADAALLMIYELMTQKTK